MIELGGFTPLSTADWPGRLAAVAFVQGCPWRCGYCHNPELQPRARGGAWSWHGVMQTLARRVGLLDGVVFSGGEPTVEPGLGASIAEVRALGLQTGLHTAGAYPRRFAALLPDLDWVGFDIKTGFDAYDPLTTRARSGEAAKRSLDCLLQSGVDHEIRTTYHPAWVSDDALLAAARSLARRGVRHWTLQRWRPHDDASAARVPQWHWPAPALLEALRGEVPSLALR